jgi:16S rRNA (guanine527-N7)-methyltransferase
MRAEDAGKNPAFRERYDIACARAVAGLSVLTEYCLPFVKPGGRMVAMKGPSAKEEVPSATRTIKLLGGAQPTIICETLTGNEQRTFVTVKKISQTPTKYPRQMAKIVSKSL